LVVGLTVVVNLALAKDRVPSNILKLGVEPTAVDYRSEWVNRSVKIGDMSGLLHPLSWNSRAIAPLGEMGGD
jgi:hypothetical protein